MAERFGGLLVKSVAAYPLLWATGFGGFYLGVMAVLAATYLVRTKVPALAQVPLWIAALIMGSIPVGVLHFHVGASRVLSALYNAGVWVLISAIVTAASRVNIRTSLSRALLLLLAAQAALVIVGLAVYPQRLPVPVFSELAGAMPGAFGDLGRPDIVNQAWLGRVVMRTSGIMSQAVSAGGFAAAAALAVASHRENPRWVRFAAVAAAAPVVYFSLARTTYALVGVALIIWLVFAVSRRDQLTAVGLAIMAVILATSATIYWWTEIVATLDEVNDLRAGSAESRGEIYGITIDYVLAHPFPLLGYGVKPQAEGLVASIATHSTVLGLAFRGGVIAALLFLAFMFILLVRATAESDVTAVTAAVFIAGWAAQADLDVGNLIPVLLAFAVVPIRNGFASAGRRRKSFKPRSRGVP